MAIKRDENSLRRIGGFFADAGTASKTQLALNVLAFKRSYESPLSLHARDRKERARFSERPRGKNVPLRSILIPVRRQVNKNVTRY